MNKFGYRYLTLQSDTVTRCGYIPQQHQEQRRNILLIHGYMGSGMVQYFKQVKHWKNSYNLYVPDLLYHGNSSTTLKNFSIEAQVDHLYSWLKASNLSGKLVVIGNSYGGIVGARFAEKYPALVEAFVIYDAPVGEYTTSYADSLASVYGRKNIEELLSPNSVNDIRIFSKICFQNPPYVPDFIVHQLLKDYFQAHSELRKNLLTYLRNKEDSLNNHYFQWSVPVYIIWGSNDQLIPVMTAKRLQKRYNIADDKVKFFPNTGHVLNLEHPKDFEKWVESHFPPLLDSVH